MQAAPPAGFPYDPIVECVREVGFFGGQADAELVDEVDEDAVVLFIAGGLCGGTSGVEVIGRSQRDAAWRRETFLLRIDVCVQSPSARACGSGGRSADDFRWVQKLLHRYRFGCRFGRQLLPGR